MIFINQGFGANYDYYHSHFGTNGHMGIDIKATHGTPVLAAHDGTATTHTDSHGGEGVYIAANGFLTVYWHLIGDTDPAFPMPFQGAKVVKAGDLIGFADNTGAPFESTGEHLHFGLCFLDANGSVLNTDNGFNGCVDPMPYFNKFYAEDAQKLFGYYRTLVEVLQKLVILKK